MTLFTDNFNRADSTLESSPISSGGGTWTHDNVISGALTIGSDLLRCGTTNTTGSAYWAADHGTKNQYVQFSAVSTLNTTGSFFCCRLADNNNFVGIRCGFSSGAGQIEVYTRIGGTFANLYRSGNSAFVNGDVLRLEVQDSTFRAYKNSTQIATGPIGDGGVLDNNTKSGILARSVAAGIGDNFQTDALAISGNTVISLVSSGIASQPIIDPSTITQNHSLSSNGISSQFSIDDSNLTQDYAFVPVGLSISPNINQPNINQDCIFVPVGSTMIPIIDASNINQDQSLNGTGLSFSFIEDRPDASFNGDKNFSPIGLIFSIALDSPSLIGQGYPILFTYGYYQAAFMQTLPIDVENRIGNINIGMIGTPDDENDRYSLDNLFGD